MTVKCVLPFVFIADASLHRDNACAVLEAAAVVAWVQLLPVDLAVDAAYGVWCQFAELSIWLSTISAHGAVVSAISDNGQKDFYFSKTV